MHLYKYFYIDNVCNSTRYHVMCLNAYHMIMIHDLDGHIKTPKLHFHTHLPNEYKCMFNSHNNFNEAKKCLSFLARQNMTNTPHI